MNYHIRTRLQVLQNGNIVETQQIQRIAIFEPHCKPVIWQPWLSNYVSTNYHILTPLQAWCFIK